MFDAQLSSIMQDVEKRAARAKEFQDAVTNLTGTGRSDTGAIEVTVDNGGNLTALVLADRALREATSGAALSADIIRCLRRAQRDVTQQMRNASDSIFAEDAELMNTVIRATEDRLRVDEDPSPTPPRSYDQPDQGYGYRGWGG